MFVQIYINRIPSHPAQLQPLNHLIESQGSILKADGSGHPGHFLQVEHSFYEMLGLPTAGNFGQFIFFPFSRWFVDETLSVFVSQFRARPW